MAAVVPQPGDIGVTPSRGWASFGIRWATHSPVAHAFVSVGGTRIVEADPHGARFNDASRYKQVTWLTGLSGSLAGWQRAAIVDWAVGRIGTPYSWLDDAAIGMRDLFGWCPAWLTRRMASTRTLMCSQLAVEAYRAAGVDLFPGRPGGSVSPGDLWRLNAQALARAAS